MWDISGWFSPQRRRQPRQVRADRQTWHFDHDREALAREREADTRDFLIFALGCGEVDPDAISRRALISLYAEFCEARELRPMSWGRFDRSLKGAGFERYRSSLPGRPWLYRAIRPGSAIIFKLPPPVRDVRDAA